jgi:hypothetical protein
MALVGNARVLHFIIATTAACFASEQSAALEASRYQLIKLLKEPGCYSNTYLGTVLSTLTGTNFLVAWMVPEIWEYLLSLDPTSPLVQQYNAECTAAALAAGTAAVRQAHDQQYGGFFESFDPKAAANTTGANTTGISKVKVWWIQNEALLALYKLHKNQANSTQPGAASTAPNYLQLLAETARFLRQHQTDNEVAGEQFWQVSTDSTLGHGPWTLAVTVTSEL